MDLSGILSIAGHGGLFKMVSQMKGGLIVESLTDGKRMPAYSTQKILALSDISIYTDAEDVPLKQLFDSIIDKTGGKAAIDTKTASIESMRDYLESVLPNFDRVRVYSSDVKRLFQWYNLLSEKGLTVKDAPKDEANAEAKKPVLKTKAEESVTKTAAPKAKIATAKAKTGVAAQRKAGKA